MPTKADTYVQWNVGQGQWSTYVGKSYCYHIDMGGEYFNNWSQLKKLCSKKKNYISISHWDYDHYSFIKNFIRRFNNYCVSNIPTKPPNSLKKVLLKSKNCTHSDFNHLQIKSKEKSKNAQSYILFHKHFFYPADIGFKQESHLIFSSLKVKILIVPHHGSSYSSSNNFLKKFSSPIQAVASARKSKYGHPSLITLTRYKSFEIPLIVTEYWGNIIFILPEK